MIPGSSPSKPQDHSSWETSRLTLTIWRHPIHLRRLLRSLMKLKDREDLRQTCNDRQTKDAQEWRKSSECNPRRNKHRKHRRTTTSKPRKMLTRFRTPRYSPIIIQRESSLWPDAPGEADNRGVSVWCLQEETRLRWRFYSNPKLRGITSEEKIIKLLKEVNTSNMTEDALSSIDFLSFSYGT